MWRVMGVLVLIFMVGMMPSQAQCNETQIAEAVTILQEQLAEVQTQQDLVIFGIGLGAVIQGCQGNAAGTESPGLNRSDPVTLGDWFTLESGQVRITGVEWLTESPDDMFVLEAGTQMLELQLEYLCTQADQNKTCKGVDMAFSYISSNAELVENYYYLMIPTFQSANEVFAGGTITGSVYFILPDDETVTTIQMKSNYFNMFAPIFFSIAEPE